ncbi:MAG: CDP-alcohol phosphatidyltransferase family protein, partial [Alphaproteobacteria bacterium]|nr:CDP-alcohol phosphatidyltransferase family protein [Alphaproteobacteria bacterium]
MLKRKSRRKSRRGVPRFKGLSISKLIPNMITVGATCAGLTGVRFAIDEKWEFAVVAIIVAGVLDALDGRMARLLNSASDFGAELDSLSDFVSFGVSPALILYFWSLSSLGGIGWAVCLFLAICCGLRLARFNTNIGKLPPYAYNYFTGV